MPQKCQNPARILPTTAVRIACTNAHYHCSVPICPCSSNSKKDIIVTDKQLENKPFTKAGHADGGALEKFQRESEELYKQYPPAKLYTKESLVEESKHLFADGQVLPDRFVLKLEPSRSVISQVDAVVKSVRNEIEKAYPGSALPATNYYAINESKAGSQYAYVGIIGGTNITSSADTIGRSDITGGVPKLSTQPIFGKVADSYDEQKRVCIGLPSYTPIETVEAQVDAMYLRADAVSRGLPESAKWDEINARTSQAYEQERHLDYYSWLAIADQRQSVREEYTKPYDQCINRFWETQ